MGFNIADIMNQWLAYGVFDYVFPFLIIFAVVFAILQKTAIFERGGAAGSTNTAKGINAVIALAVGFLALLNNHVTNFFAVIFPRFGIALAIFLVLIILLGFLGKQDQAGWVGWVLGAGVIIWAWSEWGDMFGNGFVMTSFFDDYFWGIVLVAGIGALIYWMVKSEDGGGKPTPTK